MDMFSRLYRFLLLDVSDLGCLSGTKVAVALAVFFFFASDSRFGFVDALL